MNQATVDGPRTPVGSSSKSSTMIPPGGPELRPRAAKEAMEAKADTDKAVRYMFYFVEGVRTQSASFLVSYIHTSKFDDWVRCCQECFI